MEREELKEELRRLVAERLDGTSGDKSVAVDLVNLDRGGHRGLVYLMDGAIVRKGGAILDGRHRIAAIARSDKELVMEVVDLSDSTPEPIEGAIYVPAGPTPDYLIDRGARVILIGRSRGEREATATELREACRRAINEFFGN